MNLLTFDCSGQTMAGAVARDGAVLASEFLNENRNHAPGLVPMLARLLATAGWRPADLDLIAATTGPGSFTGLRIGIATAKGFADTTGVPLLALSSLDALAANARELRTVVVPMLDARKGQVYTAAYDNRDGAMRRLFDVAPLSPVDDLPDLLAAYEQIAFFGEALPVWQERIAAAFGERAVFLDAAYNGIRGESLVRLAAAAPPAQYGADLQPLYLRGVDAKAKFKDQNK